MTDYSGGRLFFALWPSGALRDDLARQRPASGRRVREDNLHLTLVFLGEVGAEVHRELAEGATRVTASSFELSLNRRGHWRRSGIFWLAPSRVPDALMTLHGRLRALAVDTGVAVESRPYRPHVTLARKAPPHPTTEIAPIRWPVQDFVLVRSTQDSAGVRYEVIGRWPLALPDEAGPML